MPYITSIERIGIEKGLKRGRMEELLNAIELGLDLKFGEEGLKLMPEIREIDDIDVLRAIRSKIKPAKSLDELRAIYQK